MRTRSVVVAALLLLAVMAGMALRETTVVVVRDDAGMVERPKATYPYAGNTRTKKFHIDTCRYYKCTNCTAKFQTREEAKEAGYSPCGTCEP